MTHYGTKSASHAWQRARTVANAEGMYLNPFAVHDYNCNEMGRGIVLVTYQPMEHDGKRFTWYLVKSIPSDEFDLPPGVK